jgi:secreted trypsin-like serine protease
LNLKGDSGGGLAVSVDEAWTLVGIVSVGKVITKSKTDGGTCDLTDYVLYTDVAKFHSWINRVIMETHRDTVPDKLAGNNGCFKFGQQNLLIWSAGLLLFGSNLIMF